MKNLIIITIAIVLVGLCFAAPKSSAESDGVATTSSDQNGSRVFLAPAAGEQINWQVLSNGGGKGTSTNFELNATLNQTSVGASSSDNFVLGHGFWQAFGGGAPGCCIARGDVVSPPDGNVLVNDLVFLVNYIFKGGQEPACLEAGDVAPPLDGLTLINDLVFLVNYIFKGGAAPPAC